MPATLQPSPYQIDRSNRNRQTQAIAARRRQRQEFCGLREQAIQVGARATEVEARVAEYDRPESAMRDDVRAARRWRFWFRFTVVAVVLIACVDFWLGMPEVTEQLANKATSFINQVSGVTESADGGSSVEATFPATPVSLRITCGVLIVCTWLTLTLGWKWCTDPTDLRNAMQSLPPGDDEEYRRIQRHIWLRHLGRFGYMAILIGLLSYLYTFDLEKARLLVANRHVIEDAQTDSTNWAVYGLDIDPRESGSGGRASRSDDDASASAAAREDEARKLARPQVLAYALLAMLHGLLLIAPTGQKPEDPSLASFNRSNATQQARELRLSEAGIVRDLHTRIREADPELRDDLVVEATPIARRINEVLGWTAIEELGGTDPQVASTQSPSAPLDTDWSGRPNFGADHPSTGAEQDREDPEDPMQAIFG